MKNMLQVLINKTSKFLLKKEINETDIEEYTYSGWKLKQQYFHGFFAKWRQ